MIEKFDRSRFFLLSNICTSVELKKMTLVKFYYNMMLLIIFDTDEKLQRLLQIVAILTLLSKAKQIGIVENFPTRRLLEVLLKILQ